MKPWQRIEPTNQTKVGWRTITSKTFRMPDDSTAVFDTLHPDGQEFAGVIALTPDNKVIITHQFRPGPEKIMQELPGGFVDKGETPEIAVRRELLEETGYQAGALEYLGGYCKDVYMNATWHAFIARGCKKVAEIAAEQDEHIELDLISIPHLIANAKAGRMLEQATVLMAYDRLMQIQQEGTKT